MPPVLDPRLFGKIIDHLTCKSYAGHRVQDGLVGYHVTDSQDFPIQTGLDPVDVLSLPDARCDHGSAKVDKHGSGQTAHELMDYIRVRPAESPPHEFDILVYLFSCNLLLFLLVDGDSHT